MKKVLILTTISISFFFLGKVSVDAAECAPNECSSQGKYVCGNWGTVGQSGDMCCTGSGCPSWVCNKVDYWDWSQNPPECCVDTTHTVVTAKTCWRPTGRTECVAWDERCRTKVVCDRREVCTGPGGGPIALGASDVREEENSEGEVLYCWWEEYNCEVVKYGCRDICLFEEEVFVPYTCYETTTYTVGDCDPAQPSAGDTCSYCSGWDPGNGNGGGVCDPDDWGAWSACSASCGGGSQSRVNDCGTFETQDCNTQVCVNAADVQGYIWNATGQSCTNNPDEALEIVNGSEDDDISGNIFVTLDGSVSGIWNPTAFDGYSYIFEDVPTGSHVVSANVPGPIGYSNSSYALACVNNQEAAAASVNVSSDPTILHLGYRIVSGGWWHVIGGDVFGGCSEDNCIASVDVSIPDVGEILGGFVDYLVAEIGTVFTNSSASVTNSNFAEDNNRHLEFLSTESWWPTSFTFDPPSAAIEIENCSDIFQGNNLNAGEVYYGDVDCVQDGLDGLSGNYNFTNDGVAVIYVTGTDTLSFNDEFTASNSNRRIVFVVEGSIEFDSTIGTDSPTPSTDPHIQAAIIAQGPIAFPSGGTQDDSSILVEGPLVSKNGTIEFNRNRGVQNGYPGTVVVYNPYYLTELTSTLPAGITSVDISWIINN